MRGGVELALSESEKGSLRDARCVDALGQRQVGTVDLRPAAPVLSRVLF